MTRFYKLAKFLAFFLTLTSAFGQRYFFGINTSLPISINGKTLTNAWAGGFNAVQLQKMDLDNDGTEDIVLFDKTTSKISAFLSRTNSFVYAPEYELSFPSLKGWMTLADYDHDGKKDIFTNGFYSSTLKVYKNISSGFPLWKIKADTISTIGSTGYSFFINISLSDYPAIADIDNDGDIDILAYNFLSGTGIEFHKNNSIETFGVSDSLVFEKYTSCWGRFSVGFYCDSLVKLNTSCFDNGGTHDNERQLHMGSSITTLDLNNDGLQDLLLGDVSCNNIYALTNTGTNLIGRISSVQSHFPDITPVNVSTFPATFYEDIDFDGIKDLVSSPNQYINDNNASDFTHSLWQYKNTGTNSLPQFAFIRTDFLQESMVDLGENAFPALADYDNDGDLDLFIGNRGIKNGNNFYGSIYLFKNTGTKDSASFILADSDYAGFSQLNATNLKPGFLDLNNDGSTDLYLLLTTSDANAHIYYFLNENQGSNTFAFNLGNKKEILLDPDKYEPVYNFDNISIFNQENNNLPGLLIGRSEGNIELYTNTGTNTNPQFELTSRSLAGVEQSIYSSSPMPVLAHLNNKDTLELLTIDDTGAFNIYSYSSASNTIPVLGKAIYKPVYNSLARQNFPANFGNSCGFAVGDLDNDGYKDIVIGTGGGGLLFIKNLRKNPPEIVGDTTGNYNTVPGVVAGLTKPFDGLDASAVNIYPNPADELLMVISKVKASATLMNLQGSLVVPEFTLTEGKTTTFHVNNLLPGVYFLKIFNTNSTLIKKVVIF